VAIGGGLQDRWVSNSLVLEEWDKPDTIRQRLRERFATVPNTGVNELLAERRPGLTRTRRAAVADREQRWQR
jgi:hypothetical protein